MLKKGDIIYEIREGSQRLNILEVIDVGNIYETPRGRKVYDFDAINHITGRICNLSIDINCDLSIKLVRSLLGRYTTNEELAITYCEEHFNTIEDDT